MRDDLFDAAGTPLPPMLPTFKIKRSALVCARPATLLAWLAEQEAQALGPHAEGTLA
ncbi:hypothetical protein [Methylobacterium bullatum]|uniref:Uncharacterized protein n=1 Tax=Methylobacterium bullatum TaxID=570505 RepID=A0A679K9X7_9HYPH|nr:hypothetical protein MBLL_04718 [Methylobacterium bullatum]